MNATDLMCQLLDSIDRRLTNQGFGFREDKTWEQFAAQLEGLIFKFYEDGVGEDEEWVPGNSKETSSDADDEMEESEAESETLGSEDTEEEQ